MATETVGLKPSITEILGGPDAQRRVREALSHHDIATNEGRDAIHNLAYIAGIHGADIFLYAVEKGTDEYNVVKPAFEAGKAQVKVPGGF